MPRPRRFCLLLVVVFVGAGRMSEIHGADDKDPLHRDKHVSEWVQMVDGSESSTQGLAESALVVVGTPAVPHLIPLLKDKNERVRVAAIRILKQMQTDPNPFIPALIVALNDPSEQVRLAAGFAICAHAQDASKNHVPALAKSLEHRDPRVRKLAACAVAMIQRHSMPGLVAHLIEGVKDKNKDVQEQALSALESLGPDAKDALPFLKDKLRTMNDPDTRANIVMAIAWIDFGSKASIALLIKALQENDANERRKDDGSAFRYALLAGTLERIGPPAKEAVESLTQALHDPKAVVRITAAKAVANIAPEKTQEMVRILIPLLKDKDGIIRAQSAHGLVGMGAMAKEAIGPLTDLLKTEKDPFVRPLALMALQQVDPEAAKRAGISKEKTGDKKIKK